MKSSISGNAAMVLPHVCNYSSYTHRTKNYQFNSQLDTKFLTEFYENDLETACMMFTIFLDSTYKTCKEIFTSFKEHNYKLFQHLIHKVRSSFKMVGLGKLDKVFSRLENAPIKELRNQNSKNLMLLFRKALQRYVPIVKLESERLKQVTSA